MFLRMALITSADEIVIPPREAGHTTGHFEIRVLGRWLDVMMRFCGLDDAVADDGEAEYKGDEAPPI